MRESSEKVQPLYPDAKNIATGVSLVVSLANDRQITFQSGFEGDEPDPVVNARLDRLCRFADRLKAKAEIPEVEADLHKQSETLAQFREDLARVRADYERQQALRRVELQERVDHRDQARKDFETEINTAILSMQEAKQKLWNSGAEEHARGGRLTAYTPRGATAANLEKVDKAIAEATGNREKALEDFDQTYDEGLETAQAEIDKAEAEREAVERNLNISVERYEAAIAASQTHLAKCRELAGG
jgi:DNA repair exonuclease SbcCD ATPase subunit